MKWMDVCYPPHIAAHWEDTMDDLNRYLRFFCFVRVRGRQKKEKNYSVSWKTPLLL